jgi:hypothetical protein
VTAALLTPFQETEAVELGNRQWVKKILPVGQIDYKGRTLHFTRDYLGRLAAAFQSRAYDQVPFQLADAANTHTNDPERTRGEITGMEVRADGLYVTAQVTPEGEQVLTANPRLGVSARIVEDYARSDGRHFPVAIQHVLGTLDPRIPGLGAWEAIEASSPVPGITWDLTGGAFTSEKTAKAQRKAAKRAGRHTEPVGDGADKEGAPAMADLNNLNPEQRERLEALLALPGEQFTALAAGGVVLTPAELAALTSPEGEENDEGEEEDEGDGEGGEDPAAWVDGLTGDQLTALEAEFETQNTASEPGFTPGYMPEGEPVGAGLSREAQFAIDLANAKSEETARELAVVTARLREEDYQAEKRRLADLGVPPYITELAKPLLEGAGHAVELANGKTVDAGSVMRRVLSEYARQARLLDLDVELGSPMDEPEGVRHQEAEQSREDVVNRFKNLTGLK